MITATILAAERVRLPDGPEFTGRNCEGDAARHLIGLGVADDTPMRFEWHDGRASTFGTVGAYARRYHTDNGLRRWQPHPMGEYPVSLMQWAAKIAPEGKRRGSSSRRAA